MTQNKGMEIRWQPDLWRYGNGVTAVFYLMNLRSRVTTDLCVLRTKTVVQKWGDITLWHHGSRPTPGQNWGDIFFFTSDVVPTQWLSMELGWQVFPFNISSWSLISEVSNCVPSSSLSLFPFNIDSWSLMSEVSNGDSTPSMVNNLGKLIKEIQTETAAWTIGKRPTSVTSTVNKIVSLDIENFLYHICRAFLCKSYRGWSHIIPLAQWLFTMYMKFDNQQKTKKSKVGKMFPIKSWYFWPMYIFNRLCSLGAPGIFVFL